MDATPPQRAIWNSGCLSFRLPDATPRRRRSCAWTPPPPLQLEATAHAAGLHTHIARAHASHPACYCSFAADVRHLLDKMSRPITISFNLHGRLLQQRPARRVIGDLRVRAAAHESRPDRFMCADALTVCSYAVRLREGNAVLALAILDAIDGGVFAFNSFVTM
jgi:hypothetical protein